MARESVDFRLNLEHLLEVFGGKESISVSDAAGYLGTSRRRLLEDPTFPTKTIGKQRVVVIVSFARWLSQ